VEPGRIWRIPSGTPHGRLCGRCRCPSSTVIARPVIVTRSPETSTPTCPGRDDAWRPTSAPRSETVGPERTEHRVRAAGHPECRDTGGSKETGDEVVRLPSLGASRHDHCREIEAAYRNAVGPLKPHARHLATLTQSNATRQALRDIYEHWPQVTALPLDARLGRVPRTRGVSPCVSGAGPGRALATCELTPSSRPGLRPR